MAISNRPLGYGAWLDLPGILCRARRRCPHQIVSFCVHRRTSQLGRCAGVPASGTMGVPIGVSRGRAEAIRKEKLIPNGSAP